MYYQATADYDHIQPSIDETIPYEDVNVEPVNPGNDDEF